MSNYVSPSVFVESVGSANTPIESVSVSTGCFIGQAVSGPEDTPILITSWQKFLDVFALGAETPFCNYSYLANAVYGFFQNGGTRCYVIRVCPTDAESSMTSGIQDGVGATLKAKYKGTWANNMMTSFGTPISGDIPTGTAEGFITTYISDEVVEKLHYSLNPNSPDYLLNVIKNSQYFEVTGPSLNPSNYSISIGEHSYSGGSDGTSSNLQDTHFEAALNNLDNIEGVSLICAPAQTSKTMYNLLLQYVDKRGDMFAILEASDIVHSSIFDNLISERSEINGKSGALYANWIKVVDPLSKTGALMSCPPCGHIMGVYARIIQERGVWKAPAGTEASIKGALDVSTRLVLEDIDKLNSEGINVVLPKPNYGVVVWGAKSLNTTDDNLKYVSDVLLNINIKESIKQSTQWAVFEPNNSVLWTKLTASTEAFMDGLWRAGAFYGSEAKEAYFVKCDEELNTEEVRKSGKVICEVGYAANKPAEFVVIRIAHSINA